MGILAANVSSAFILEQAMRFGRYLALALVGFLFVCSSTCLIAQAPSGERQQDEQAIRRVAQEYLAALARGDAKAMGQLWTADGDVVDEAGRSFPARSVIMAEASEREAARPVRRPPGDAHRLDRGRHPAPS